MSNIHALLIVPTLLLLLSSAITTPLHADFDPMIRLDPRIDRFTQRIHARYGILPDGVYRQPMGTLGFLSYLDTVAALPLTAQERYMLEGLRRQLSISRHERAEIIDSADLRGTTADVSGIYGFYNHEGDGYGVVVNLDLTADAWAHTGGGGDLRMGGRGIISPSLRGYIGNFSFYTAMDVWTEYVYDSLFFEGHFQPYDGVPAIVYGRDNRSADAGGNMRSSELPRAGISYNGGRIGLEAAIDYLRVGPAVHYPLTLSGNAPPITYARATFDFTRMEYWHVVGILRSQKDKPKYIYSNGLRGSLLDGRLRWGISEVMIGGSTTNQQDNDPLNPTREEFRGEEQGWEWAYFVPFVPMAFVEAFLGDRQNAAIALDFDLNWPQNFRFYGEFHIDDMLTPWEIFSDDWGNKWALTLGMQYFTTLYGRDLDVGIEWSRVEPWVYTHTYGGSHRYDHFDKPLGSPMGPNSMAIAANAGMSVTKKGMVGLKLTSLSNNPTARGGNITDIFQFVSKEGFEFEPDSETKRFLGPGTIHYLRPGIYMRYDPFGPFRVNAEIEVETAHDRGKVRFALDGGFRF
ncbi:MAG: hypothetical protein LBU70_00470 [Chitinispirillales bacterium]|nr:hypothetical protein [Chitinispirillales bacterium]